MLDKHAISLLNQQDKTPGQPMENRAGQSAISRFTRRAFPEGGVWLESLLRECPFCLLHVQRQWRRQQQRLRRKPQGLYQWSSG
jgi:hypothetical protein